MNISEENEKGEEGEGAGEIQEEQELKERETSVDDLDSRASRLEKGKPRLIEKQVYENWFKRTDHDFQLGF
jgi:hypothetical protein